MYGPKDRVTVTRKLLFNLHVPAALNCIWRLTQTPRFKQPPIDSCRHFNYYRIFISWL